METNIRHEYERLKLLASTSEGFGKVEADWMIASNYELSNNGWIKKRASAGDHVAGFAVDTQAPFKTLVHPKGYSHERAYFDLVEEVADAERSRTEFDLNTIEFRIKRGWAAYSENWAYPLLTINESVHMDHELVGALAESMLEREIGLPWFSICYTHYGFGSGKKNRKKT